MCNDSHRPARRMSKSNTQSLCGYKVYDFCTKQYLKRKKIECYANELSYVAFRVMYGIVKFCAISAAFLRCEIQKRKMLTSPCKSKLFAVIYKRERLLQLTPQKSSSHDDARTSIKTTKFWE